MLTTRSSYTVAYRKRVIAIFTIGYTQAWSNTNPSTFNDAIRRLVQSSVDRYLSTVDFSTLETLMFINIFVTNSIYNKAYTTLDTIYKLLQDNRG